MPYIGNPPRVANFLVDSFSGDAIETEFNMQIPVGSPAAVLVFIDGVRQATESYAVNNRVITFDDPPPSGTDNIEVLHIAMGVTASAPSDLSVTDAKLTTTGVTSGQYGGTANLVVNTVNVNDKGRVINVANIAVSSLDFSGIPTGGGSVEAGRLYKESNNIIFIKT